MNNMMIEQRGVTFIGWCFILAILAFFVTITLRLFPLYNEKMQVIAAMNSVAKRPGAESMQNSELLKNFMRTAQVGGSSRFDDKSIKELAQIEKPDDKGGRKKLHVTFEARNKFFQDIEFVLNFDHSVELGAGSTGE